MSVLLETSLGNLVVDLYTEQCPRASLNFLKLCKIKYYNFSLFHSVQRGFLAQTGAPPGFLRTRDGGQSIYGILNGPREKYFPLELHPSLKHDRRGLLVMAALQSEEKDAGGALLVNGSQFFLTLGERLEYLDGKYTIFGEVVEGWETLLAIENAFVDDQGRPLQDIRIKHTIILDDPYPDPLRLPIPDRSPSPSRDVLESDRLRDDEPLADEQELSAEEQERLRREQDAKAKALTLEMIGDLPYADIKPPENILFVCKLNSVTQDEDLELIFSRFGKILSCEIIRDKLTGDSLCYAFIEFEDKDACEEAYFKMQNVLIDDRRIQVDFSQSVSKLHNVWLQQRLAKMGIPKTLEEEGYHQKQHYRGNGGAGADVGGSRREKRYDLVLDEDRSESLRRSTDRERHDHSSPRVEQRRDRDRHHSTFDRYREEPRLRRSRSRSPPTGYRERPHHSHSHRQRSQSPRRRHHSHHRQH